jgi:hypothetical protein
MIESPHGPRRPKLFLAGVCVAAILPVAAAPPAMARAWTDTVDAITRLWNINQAPNAWLVANCNNKTAMPQNVQALAVTPGSGYVILKVPVTSTELTDNLRSLARALLNISPTNNGNNAQNAFYPTDPDQNPPITMNADFWEANARSAHVNGDGYLPTVDLGNLVNPPVNCPANIAPKPNANRSLSGLLNRRQTMDALSTAALTNQQRWHCYSFRFADPKAQWVTPPKSKKKNAPEPVPQPPVPVGYVEITHFEKPQTQGGQYPEANASGRLVYDYVQGLVYYTPAHYAPWFKANFNPVGKNDDFSKATACSPFVQIQ